MKSDWTIVLGCLLVAPLTGADAQQVPASPPDSLRLGALQQQAVATDPRQRQFDLLSRQTELRLENLTRERLPSFTLESHAQYQSVVFTGPPGSATFPVLPKDTYDNRLSVEQAILEPSIGPRRKVERAQLAESNARVRTNLFTLRQEVNEAFFTAALLGERIRIIRITITDLEKQLQEAEERVREGAALPSDTAAIRATLIERHQDLVDLGASRRAALVRLAQLTGRAIGESDALVLPDLVQEAAQARAQLDQVRSRPEYELYASTRERLARQKDVVTAGQWPVVSAYASAGYGQPGLDPINTTFDSYWLAGVKLRWEPWNWGSYGRERQDLELERQIVTQDEAAFANSLTRSIQEELATIDRLDSTLVMDQQIIQLRQQVETETLPRFQEGVVTASEYLDRSTDVLEARLAQVTHRVEQAQARARFLTALGLEIR